MQRVDPVDASFLHIETPTMHSHVVGVMILDPVTMAPGDEYEAIRAALLRRLYRLPVLKERIVTAPMGLDLPYRVPDPDFSIDNHLFHAQVRNPGGQQELAALIGQIASRQLERHQPLWDATVVSGLEGSNIAFVVKMHHAIADGVTATEMLSELFDLEPHLAKDLAQNEVADDRFTLGPPDVADEFDDANGPTSGASDHAEFSDGRFDADDGADWEIPAPGPIPTAATLLSLAVANHSELASNFPGLLTKASSSIFAVARASTGAKAMAAPFSGPPTVINGTLGPRRVVALGSVSLDKLRVIGAQARCTINDVLLAACTAGLRAYLLDRGPLPTKPVVASIPVSLHHQLGADRIEGRTNRISTLLARLPVQLSDPVEQVRAVAADTRMAKQNRSDGTDGLLGDVLAASPPLLVSTAARVASRSGMTKLLPPVQNLTVSNVAGPPLPVYLAGARLVSCYPFGPLIEGSGLSITAMSNLDHLDIGIIACPDLVDDPEAILEAITEGVRILYKALVERGITTTADYDTRY